MKQLALILLIVPFLSLSQIQIGDDIDGEAGGDYSGYAVSLSSDGSIVAIGATNNSDNGFYSGHVRVYENIGGSWVQIGDDIDGEEDYDRFGVSVSLSLDGSIVVISAIPDHRNSNNSERVLVFKNINNNWIQIGLTIEGEEIFQKCGISNSISSDGSIIAFGAPQNNGNGENSGYVKVYKNIENNWVQIGQNINGEEISQFGTSVSLSSNGNIVAGGAIHGYDVINMIYSGFTRIYENINNNWIQVGQDIFGEYMYDDFGSSISLSSDGSIVAIGAKSGVNNNGMRLGYVRVYKNIENNWVQIGQTIFGEAVSSLFGTSLSLSSDGSIITISAILNNGNSNQTGSVQVYKNIENNWVQIGDDIDGEAAYDLSGVSVSLSSYGSVVAIGAYQNDGNGNDSGHVRVYDLSALLSVEESTLSGVKLYPNPTTNQFTIEFPEGQTLEKVNLYNSLGQFIQTTKENIINTTNLSAGLYFVEVITNQVKATKKLIIE